MKIINTKPKLFEKTNAAIWTESHIQKMLLEAHLDFSSDAASRNIESINTIVDYINEKIKPASHILDLGCGPGLYSKLLSEFKHTVVGVDFNRLAIEYARKENSNIEYIEADYIQNFPLGKYDAIIMIYCDMGTHSDNNRDALLQNCYQSLNDGGKLIFDVFDERIINDKKETNSWEYAINGGFWAENEYLILNQTFHYPHNRAFAYQYNLVRKDTTKHFIIWDRYYTKEEITNVLAKIGFENVLITDNILDRNNFTSNSEMFIIAEK